LNTQNYTPEDMTLLMHIASYSGEEFLWDKTPDLVWTSWRRENSSPYWDLNSDPLVVQPTASPYTALNLGEIYTHIEKSKCHISVAVMGRRHAILTYNTVTQVRVAPTCLLWILLETGEGYPTQVFYDFTQL
jgi:hypothetical protein